MKKFVIERSLPGASNLSGEELRNISEISNIAINRLNEPYYCLHSFITDDKIYCIHMAESEETVRKHSRLAGFPINKIAEVKTVVNNLIGGQLE